MKISGYEKIGNKFTDLFAAAEHSIEKVGVLQDYTDEYNGPSVQAWANRQFDESMQLAREDPEFIKWIQQCKESPASVTRIQLIEQPPGPYAAWSSALAREYEARGAETFRPVSATAELLGRVAIVSGNSDFVVFDNQTVLRWIYEPDSKGRVVGGEVLKGEGIRPFTDLRDALIEESI